MNRFHCDRQAWSGGENERKSIRKWVSGNMVVIWTQTTHTTVMQFDERECVARHSHVGLHDMNEFNALSKRKKKRKNWITMSSTVWERAPFVGRRSCITTTYCRISDSAIETRTVIRISARFILHSRQMSDEKTVRQKHTHACPITRACILHKHYAPSPESTIFVLISFLFRLFFSFGEWTLMNRNHR